MSNSLSSIIQEFYKCHLLLLLLSLLMHKVPKQGMHFNIMKQMICQQCRDSVVVYWFLNCNCNR